MLLTPALLLLLAPLSTPEDPSPTLPSPRAVLHRQTFWDNRDWDWYEASIPLFECPDPALETIYYYRWELLTKHLTYGSPASGYSFTEFIDRPFWSGTYGAISCPAGLQLYEARWLRDPRAARDYSRYWFRTPGAQPRRYSTWLADSLWAVHRVHPDEGLVTDLLPDLVSNFEGWKRDHFDPEAGLFWQTGHDDGMEYNINSRQTQDIVRGAPGYRPTLNAYLWADALAISRAADLAGRPDISKSFRDTADSLKKNLQAQLWDPARSFFFHKFRSDEEKDGFTVKAGTLTYQSGRFAGSPEGRELIGYVPWQFNLPDPGRGYEQAWKFLMDPNYFLAPFGPTVTGRRDPLFLVTDSCCWWSGQSWPYATTQTLKALANLLQQSDQAVATPDDYLRLLQTYAATHRKDGAPYIAEGANPDTGSWQGYDTTGHSNHYFHSGYVDLILTGLVGLVPRDDDTLELAPLAPADWPYLAAWNVPYRGRTLSILWDRDGSRYGLGPGLHVLADGRPVAHSDSLSRLERPLPPAAAQPPSPSPVNFAVNNDGTYFPRSSASFTSAETSLSRLFDGNYWYHAQPPNRWAATGSPNASDSIVLDLGTPRRLDTLKLYFLDDPDGPRPPSSFDVEIWSGNVWVSLPDQSRHPALPEGRRANLVRFPEREITRLRFTFHHAPGAPTGLTEIEAWGPPDQSLDPAPPPAGNLAFNPGDRPFPNATASFTSRFDAPERAIDGRVNFQPEPNNRWTAYESPHDSDWLEIDLGQPQRVSRAEIAFYDDRGGVQPPRSYHLETWDGTSWHPVPHPLLDPPTPTGGRFNTVRFDPVQTSRLRLVLLHRDASRSGLTELLIWPD